MVDRTEKRPKAGLHKSLSSSTAAYDVFVGTACQRFGQYLVEEVQLRFCCVMAFSFLWSCNLEGSFLAK